MSTYLSSRLGGNAVIDWNAEQDLLWFDDPAVSAASLTMSESADGRGVTFADASGRTITLLGVSPAQLGLAHLRFADGSRLLAPSADNAYSWQLQGGAGADLLIGSSVPAPLALAESTSAGTPTLGLPGDPFTQAQNATALSGDGRTVAFASVSPDLVSGDTNRVYDVFAKDVRTGQLVRVSTASDGGEADGASGRPTVSFDGRFVAFESTASNLVAGDSNGTTDVFVKDLKTGATIRASTSAVGAQADSACSDASISADGRMLVFTSASNTLAPDGNGLQDVFLKNLGSGAVSIVSRGATAAADGVSLHPVLSLDGRYVAFESYATNLIDGDTNGTVDVFVRDLALGTLTRVSTDEAGAGVTGASTRPAISADGRYVAFESYASDLVAGDTNGTSDIFVKDLLDGTVVCASVAADGTQATNQSNSAAISGDGRYVVFYSAASNLVNDDESNWFDFFVKDLHSGAVARLDVGPSGTAGQPSLWSSNWRPSISADGSMISFNASTVGLLPGDPSVVSMYTVGNPLLQARLVGGAGNDTYQIQHAGDLIVEAAGGGVDTVRSSVSLTLADNVENLVLTGSASIDAIGNAGANVLSGNAGRNLLDGGAGSDTASYAQAGEAVVVDLAITAAQDTGGGGIDTLVSIENLVGSAWADTLLGNAAANALDGGRGADLLIGGGGNDVYVVDDAGDRVVEAAGGGTDTIRSTLSLVLGADVENLTLLGSANLDATGNGGANVLAGNRGNNRLDGGLGADTASYVTALAGVSVGLDIAGLQSTGGAGVDTLVSIENLTGSNFNDTLHGSVGSNVLNGGAGIDTLSYARAAGPVTVSLALTTAQATGAAGSDTVLQFENLVGSALADRLTGSGGDNLIDGGAGADRMTGGGGNDRYVVDNAGDVVVEAAGQGNDTVLASVSATLSLDVENLTLTGTAAINGTGNAGSNYFIGNAAANRIDGQGGIDTVSYSSVTTRIVANLGTGTVSGAGGTDTLVSIENVSGGTAGDSLTGNALANTLTGNAGSDVLTGLGGADVFNLTSLVGSDTVTDFASGVDRLRLSQAAMRIGDGDTNVDGATTIASPGGFAASAELVIVTTDIAGPITAQSAAAAIGASTGYYAPGATALFVVDNGIDTGVYRFVAGGGYDRVVSAGELTLVATLSDTPSTTVGDYLFGA